MKRSGEFRARLGYLALAFLALAFPVAIGSFQRAGAPSAAPQNAVTSRATAAANAFLATLTDAQRAKGTFGFSSSQRTGWSNLPSGIFQRNGLRLGDLTSGQRDAVLTLVASVLSREGSRGIWRRVWAQSSGIEEKISSADNPAAARRETRDVFMIPPRGLA